MTVYERLYKLNKAKRNSPKTVRIIKEDKYYYFYDGTCNKKKIVDLSSIYHIIKKPYIYIVNFSILRNSSLLKSYSYSIYSYEWSIIYSKLREFDVIEKFSIVRVSNIFDYYTKMCLLQTILLETPFYILLLTRNNEIKLITDVLFNIRDTTAFDFRCLPIKNIIIDNIDFRKITTLENLFLNCHLLRNVCFRNIDTSNVEYFTDMFKGCYNLVNVNVDNLDTSNAKNFRGMFEDCSSLVSLNLNGFNVRNVITFSNMFKGCSALNKLEINNWVIDYSADCKDIFKDCIKLDKLKYTVQLVKKYNLYDYEGNLIEKDVLRRNIIFLAELENL